MHDLAERHAELVLVARELDAVLDVRHFLAERPDAGQPARGAFHESREVGTEQVETGIGIAAEVAGLLPGAGDDEGAAERPLVAGLAIALVGHVLRAGRAHVVLDVLIEHRPGARCEMRHHVFPEQPAPVGEPLGVLVGRRVEHEARILAGPGRQDDDARLLGLAFLLVVVIFDPRDLVALRIGEHARDGRARPHLGARLPGVGQIGHHRVGERPDRAADMAPAVIDAGRPALVFGRVHADRGRHHADAGGLEPLEPDVAVAECLHRRHRIGLAGGTPDFLRLGVAGDTEIIRNLVVIGRDVLVGDRPVERAVMLALDLEVVRQQPRKIREIVQRRAADAPSGLIGVAVGILAFEQERRTRGF